MNVRRHLAVGDVGREARRGRKGRILQFPETASDGRFVAAMPTGGDFVAWEDLKCC